MPPVMSVTTALILAFVLGLGLTAVNGNYFKNTLIEFRDLVTALISKAIIPFLPIYIFCIFLKIGAEGQVGSVLQVFIKVIVVIFIMHIVLLLFQFCVAGIIAKKNPFKALITMLPAYMTALGTQSSAATIPVTLAQAKKNGVNEDIACGGAVGLLVLGLGGLLKLQNLLGQLNGRTVGTDGTLVMLHSRHIRYPPFAARSG